MKERASSSTCYIPPQGPPKIDQTTMDLGPTEPWGKTQHFSSLQFIYLSYLVLVTESWLTQIHSYCSFLDAIQFYMYYPQNLTYFSWIWKKLYNFTYTFLLVCLNTISSKAHYHRACQMWAFMLAIKALSILWDPFYLLKLVFHCFWKYSFSPISIKVPFPI